jgi:hypothetical protein
MDTDEYYGIWEDFFKSNRMKQKVRNAQVRAERDRYADVKIEEYQNYEPIEVKPKPKPRPKPKVQKEKVDNNTSEKNTVKAPISKTTKRKTKADYDKIIDEIIAEKTPVSSKKTKTTDKTTKETTVKQSSTKSTKSKTTQNKPVDTNNS